MRSGLRSSPPSAPRVMSMFRVRRPTTTSAVLHLTHEVAEWLDDSDSKAVRYGRAAVLGSSPQDLAAAATEARKAAGANVRPCVLVLSGKLVEQKLLTLPEVARGELERILPRKAATLLSVDLSGALYAALPLAKEQRAEDAPSTEQKWFLLALRRALLAPLALELRRQSIEVDRLVCGALSRLCAAQSLRGDPNEPCIVVDVDLDDVVVSLIQGDSLRMHNRIAGTFAGAPTMALSLVQEIRSFDAYSRKASRGAGVLQVVVLGIDPDRAKLFANAVGAALPGARVVVKPDGQSAPAMPEPDGAAARVESLRACRATGALALEAPLPTPPRMATLVTVAGCALAFAGSAGAVMQDRLSRELQQLRSSRSSFVAESAGLEELRENNARVEGLLREAALETERLAERSQVGTPVAELLEAAYGVIGRHGSIRSISAERFAGQGVVRFSGFAPADPVDAVRSLKWIERGLEATPTLQDVTIDPPALRIGESDAAMLSFEGRARWEEHE